jgi:hypothetical protein
MQANEVRLACQSSIVSCCPQTVVGQATQVQLVELFFCVFCNCL